MAGPQYLKGSAFSDSSTWMENIQEKYCICTEHIQNLSGHYSLIEHLYYIVKNL
jgi:hypothetical protein